MAKKPRILGEPKRPSHTPAQIYADPIGTKAALDEYDRQYLEWHFRDHGGPPLPDDDPGAHEQNQPGQERRRDQVPAKSDRGKIVQWSDNFLEGYNSLDTPLEKILEWHIQLKVYHTILRDEMPFHLPLNWFRDETMHVPGMRSVHEMPLAMKAGDYSFILSAPEDYFDAFVDWCTQKGDLKIIGITQITS